MNVYVSRVSGVHVNVCLSVCACMCVYVRIVCTLNSSGYVSMISTCERVEYMCVSSVHVSQYNSVMM